MTRSIITIAAGIQKIYNDAFQSRLDEMKMHKLLYFAQKTHYKFFGEWLFEEDQEGWVHGPVNRQVRNTFQFLQILDNSNIELTLEEEFTIRDVVYEYGEYTSWQLRQLSHGEKAYLISREGLLEDQPGNKIIEKSNIIKDIEKDAEVSALDLDCEVLQ